MKIMTCYDCATQLSGADREVMLKEFYNHYMAYHKPIITGATESEKKAWMEQFEKDWQAAEGG